ncbi:unnamed protein product [Rotaria sp. Silwood1]|nr:unnamed protein product [Rotaria sp. Silwood1]CAF1513180.1 unnamed protein product [Rotaria sp. Silwood1]CAF3586399.1 unnamed protein product [Rotaria sp. Silwood1]CAF4786840.1 unnamed protein product [Rotaria sp. Silwood1]
MLDGPLQWYFLFGIIQNGVKMPVDLRFRPPLYQRLFYHTIEIEHHVPETERIIERQETESVEKIVAINKSKIHIINLNVKMEPQNTTKMGRLLKRPYFDRLEEQELSGDFRSRDHPFGYSWMLFPSPESLMTPNIMFYEGQKWSVKMISNLFEIHYELIKIDHEQHIAYIDGRNGICLNRAAGNKKWNASWIVDTRSGIIKRMQLELDHEYESPKRTIHKTINKVLIREVDEQTILDYEIEDNNGEDL